MVCVKAVAQVTRQLDVSLHFPRNALFRLLQIIRHEAAIDEKIAAIGKPERRIDVKTGATVICCEKMPFL